MRYLKNNNNTTNNNFKLLKTINVKNFTKLLMVVVLLASYSCVQDTTEDLAPIISEPGLVNGGVKPTLQVSMPASSRTALGEKDEESNKYPVVWCESDVLAVNGKPTTSIRINEEAANVAVFDLPLGITIPYHIVYPYQGEDVAINAESGAYPVVFAAEQKHTEGTFAPNSAPMYAWSNGFDAIEMKHLATALRFSIKAKAGESVDLRYVSVSTVEAEPIAGVFDIYCATDGDVEPGTMKARESATSTVYYNFEGDSYTLSDTEESVFYVAIPSGEYARFEVNFVAQSGQVCVRTFDATGDLALKAGKVREFPAQEFSADSKMFLIGSDADMQAFAEAVKSGSFVENGYNGALLVSDVDMTGKSWEPLVGYKSVFEGRNNTIKGLTVPLFGENTVATISNVSVEGNLVEEANGKVGLIARSLSVDGDLVGTIFNCSATGTIEYKNSTLSVDENFDTINVGGIVGGVYGGKVSLSESYVSVLVTTAAGADAIDKEYTPCIGGVVGYACKKDDKLPEVVENTNGGIVKWDDNSGSAKVTPYIGGVAGYITDGAFTDNVNSGLLFINEPMYDLDWGGVLGASAVTIERCENKGSMTINEQITTANIGGVIGKLEKASALNCENSGELLFDSAFKIMSTCNIGGVVAYAVQGTKDIHDCVNSGSITYRGECAFAGASQTSGNANLVLGGVIGTTWSETVRNCSNLTSAEINVAGKVSSNGTRRVSVDLSRKSAIAGVIGVRAGRQKSLGCESVVVAENCSNGGDVTFSWDYCGAADIFSSGCIGVFDSDRAVACNNDGHVNYKAKVEASSYVDNLSDTNIVLLYLSGLFGCVHSSCDQIIECKNNGSITISDTTAQVLNVSGLLGTTMSNVDVVLTDCANTGSILVAEDVTIAQLYLGGIISRTYQMNVKYLGCYNSGNVESKATATAETYIGSIFGSSSRTTTAVSEDNENVYNSGTVTYSGKSAIAYVGGYCGQYQDKSHTIAFVNTSTGVVRYQGTASIRAYVGGIIGLGGLATLSWDANYINALAITKISGMTGGAFNMSNQGNVSIVADGQAPEIYVGGAFGAAHASSGSINGLSNSGVVEVLDNTETYNYPDTFYVGGLFGYADMGVSYPVSANIITKDRAIYDCYNSGEVIYKGIARDGACVGGIVGRAIKAPVFNCTNDGDVTSKGNAGELSPLVGTENAEKVDAHEYANYHDQALAIGGVIGMTDLDVVDSVNNGEVEHECVLSPLRISYLGDLATSRFDVGGIIGRVFTSEEVTAAYACTFSGIINNGEVTILGTPSATLCSPSADTESNGDYQWTDVDDYDRQNKRLFTRVNVAGLIGRMFDLSYLTGPRQETQYTISGSANNAAVSVPNAGGAKCLSIAGGVADIIVSNLDFTSVTNKGKISVERAGVGTIINSKQMIHAYFINLGGIAATCFDYRYYTTLTSDVTLLKAPDYAEHYVNFNQCINEGAIHYGETGASVFQCAGGILGQVLNTGGDRASSLWYKTRVNIKFTGCKNSGNIDYLSTAMNLNDGYNYNYAGGILGTGNMGHAGFVQHYGLINLVFDHCENTGSVQFDRSNGVMSNNKSVETTVVGGIVGHYCGGIGHSANADNASGLTTTRENACNAQIISCKNSGRIYGFAGVVGGIIGCGSWYVKITGTEDDPTINTGDIVVAREGGKVVMNNRYGPKPIYAGGIAGILREYTSAAYAVKSADGDNNAHPDYMPEHQYCRVEYAVNEGAVGGTGYVGGIAGYYWSAVKPSEREGALIAHRGGMEFCRNTGAVYALEGATQFVGAIVGVPRMFTYSANSNSDVAVYLSDQGPWPVGVKNCYVGGSVWYNAVEVRNVDATNFMNAIYGELWSNEAFESIVADKPYDGCELYVPAEEQPEGGEGEEPEPMARR